MSIRFVSSCGLAAAAFLILSPGANLRAATTLVVPKAGSAANQQQQSQATAAPVGSEAGLLQAAYNTLSVADHDYKGHRVKAMKHIEAAAKLLGLNLQGDGKGHEKQFVSDAQLREAQTQLQQVSSSLTGRKQPRVAKQVDAAITEISTALSIR